MMRTEKVIVEKYNNRWVNEFQKLKIYFQQILGDSIISIEHVGSTAVCGLAAKPIIDIDVIIKNYSNFTEVKSKLKKYGYYYEGDLGIKDRHAFRYNKSIFMAHHLYVCPKYSKELKRHILFRNYLRSHEEDMKKYAETKLKGASIYPENIEKYMKYKENIINEIYRKLNLK